MTVPDALDVPLMDEVLLAEVVLLGELMVVAAACSGRVCPRVVDRVLGVPTTQVA